MAITAYAELRARVTAILADVDPAAAASTVVPACPAWTVTDTVAHLTGVCIDIVDGAIGDDVGTAAWADSHVTRFSALGLPALLERWQETAGVIDSLAGVLPDRIASQFCFDATTHEHDVRQAISRPGARDSTSVHVALGFVEAMVDGQVRSLGLPSLELDLGGDRVQVGDGPAEVRLHAEPFDVLRAFGGRRSIGQIRAMDWSADPAPFLAVFERTPLVPPAADLVE